ncbi:hypothetical protein KDN32_12170 [Nocardioides sp. J2M5]|uniref:hypothetical protein n=1 Tax=Nocardioides palaemonis TaxID=2829810 RepID=UPI001BAD5C5E|nr:hypothetical protein [Nocardioides palaemonis]MBS2938500.1 hypothetical protein [Nocardioides palaemonis]
MAVIALTSASGSPGVTTTAVGLALSWPRPVLLVEADPTGSSAVLAGYFRGTREYEAGLVELALAPVAIADALRDVVTRLNDDHAWFVAGTRAPSQAGSLTPLWTPLAEALADLNDQGQDVIVDAGRLGLAGTPAPLLETADLTLLLTRSDLPALASARAWATSANGSSAWRNGGAILIGEGNPYSHREVAKVLDLPVIATLPDAPREAAVFHRGSPPPRNFDAGPLARGLRATAASVQAAVSRSRAELAGQP